MTAGRLNSRVRIERRAATSDIYGNTQGAWQSLIAGEPAEIRPIRAASPGVEIVDAASIVAAGLVEILVRYSSRTLQIRVSDRLVNTRTGEAFNIRAIENPDMRGKYLRLLCQAGVANG